MAKNIKTLANETKVDAAETAQEIRNDAIGRQKNRSRKRGSRRRNGNAANRASSSQKSELMADIEDAIKKPGIHNNEIRFYALNPALLQGAGRVQFSSILGNPLPTELGAQAVAGVMRLTWTPQLGGKIGATVINRAANDYYSYVVHANSRNTSYTAADLMMTTLGVAEVFAALGLGIKAYGLMKEYEAQSTYTPDVLLKASGFNAADLRKNYSHMWFDLNNLIVQANTLWVPNDMPFMERRLWMNMHVFTDGRSPLAQCYTFKPHNFFAYTQVESPNGGKLVPIFSVDPDHAQVGFDNLTWDQYITAVQQMITQLNYSEDRGVMMGDILKAYGTSRLMMMHEIPLDYSTGLVYDPLVLSQIENATVAACYTNEIFQSDGEIGARAGTSRATAAGTASESSYWVQSFPSTALLNVHHAETPSVEEITEITRLTAVGVWPQYTAGTAKEYGMQPWACGTESVTEARIYKITTPITTPPSTTVYVFTSVLPTIGASSAAQWFLEAVEAGFTYTPSAQSDMIRAICSFDWCPITYTVQSMGPISKAGTTPRETALQPYLVDMANYSSFEVSLAERLHTACLYSEFGLGARK